MKQFIKKKIPFVVDDDDDEEKKYDFSQSKSHRYHDVSHKTRRKAKRDDANSNNLTKTNVVVEIVRS